MNKLALLASLAVAAGASAALKDPADVASDWSKTIAEAREPLVQPFGLHKNLIKPPPVWAESDTAPGLLPPRRTQPLPGYRIQKTPPENMPPGSMPWEFGGQTYWLVPLSPLVRA